MSSKIIESYSDTCKRLNIKPTARHAVVSIEKQTLTLITESGETRTFTVSTSKNPPSCLQDSGGTPNGLHRIKTKIGENASLGEVFKSRVPQNRPYWEFSEEEQTSNLITTRILWLDGLEANKNKGDNCDSYQRYIYIHGTNHEDRIGRPASGGCVVLKNQEVIELFDLLCESDHVYISLS
ncbi:L,D-transpeptidase [Puniceicoccaceae bacterium K14]|nr:L,D-transpeptidase [Puniceicoccaceae bacterium K14]